MGGGHAAPTVTQNCGPTIIISGNNDHFNAPGANLSGSNCSQDTKASATGATVKTKVDPNIVVPGLLQNMRMVDLTHNNIHAITTQVNINGLQNLGAITNTRDELSLAVGESYLHPDTPFAKAFHAYLDKSATILMI